MGTVPGDAIREAEDGTNSTRNLRRDFEALRADFASMRDHLKTVLGDVRSNVGDQMGKATGSLKDHPLILIGGSLCIGFALGALIMRR